MSNVGNPTPPEYRGVSVEHPSLQRWLKNAANQGMNKEEAKRLSGVPMEIVDRYYKEAQSEKK